MESQGHVSFTDLLRQSGAGLARNLEADFMDEFDDVVDQQEVSVTPQETPRSKKGKPPRGPSFIEEDDKILISAYLNISQDPIIGNGQKNRGYWNRVSEYYHKTNSTGKRTASSLMNRWSDIQRAVNKFCGFYEQVERRNRSGHNDDDKVNEAKAMYKEYIKKAFKFEHAWKILRYEEKWLARPMIQDQCNDKDKGKQKVTSSSSPESINLGEDDASTPISYSQTIRPGGRKAAKASVANQRNEERHQAKLQETLDRMDENALKMHTEKMGLLKDAMLVEKEKEQRKREKSQREAEKAQRDAQRDAERNEHMILTMDTSNLDTPTKAYYKLKKRDILKRAGVL